MIYIHYTNCLGFFEFGLDHQSGRMPVYTAVTSSELSKSYFIVYINRKSVRVYYINLPTILTFVEYLFRLYLFLHCIYT